MVALAKKVQLGRKVPEQMAKVVMGKELEVLVEKVVELAQEQVARATPPAQETMGKTTREMAPALAKEKVVWETVPVQETTGRMATYS